MREHATPGFPIDVFNNFAVDYINAPVPYEELILVARREFIERYGDEP